jgi:hypothetical protein
MVNTAHSLGGARIGYDLDVDVGRAAVDRPQIQQSRQIRRDHPTDPPGKRADFRFPLPISLQHSGSGSGKLIKTLIRRPSKSTGALTANKQSAFRKRPSRKRSFENCVV